MPATQPDLTKLPLRAAMEARDLGAIVDSFAPDAIFRSPLTAGLVFTGRDQIRALTEVLLGAFKDFRYTDELRGEHTAFLVSRARVGRQDIEMAEVLRLNPEGKIAEMTVFFRPPPATAAALRVIGAGLGRRKSPAMGALMSFLSRPLAAMTRVSDALAVRLVRASL